jgi:2-iminobutanoate/2-iminopropanoate deaminase
MRDVIPASGRGHGHIAGMVPGVRAGGFLFLSAIRGRLPSGEMPDQLGEQSRQALQNLRAQLEAAGAGLEHVVKVVIYVNEGESRDPFHEAWCEFFPDNPPARIVVRVADAGANVGSGALLALDVTALDPEAGARAGDPWPS